MQADGGYVRSGLNGEQPVNAQELLLQNVQAVLGGEANLLPPESPSLHKPQGKAVHP